MSLWRDEAGGEIYVDGDSIGCCKRQPSNFGFHRGVSERWSYLRNILVQEGTVIQVNANKRLSTPSLRGCWTHTVILVDSLEQVFDHAILDLNFHSRVRQTKRDGKDYQSVSGVSHMLNNAESVLQKGDVKDAIEGYEELFAGAREEVRRMSFRTRVHIDAPSTCIMLLTVTIRLRKACH